MTAVNSSHEPSVLLSFAVVNTVHQTFEGSVVTTTTAPSRRERQRAATMAEIRTEARALLATEGIPGVSLRAVARRMGLTPAALYRYVDSHEELLDGMSADIHRDLVADLERARDALDPSQPGERLLAVSRAFRAWALARPREFSLVFANPMTPLGKEAASELEAAGQHMGAVFAGAFLDVLTSGTMAPPDEGSVDPELLAAVTASASGLTDLPPPVLVRFVECWTRLYGCVALEVSGHLHWAMDDTAPMFELTLRQLAELIGAPDLYRPTGS
jgi:AcrR family transcriptional regulator